MLPKQYAWLEREPGPRMLVEALKLYGTAESAGDADNPVILSWAKALGPDVVARYTHDATPWCGLFIGYIAKQSGKNIPGIPERASEWLNFGLPMTVPMLGDVLIFKRDGGGHVGLYIGEDDGAYHVLGGNQHDCVCIVRIDRVRLAGVRRPYYQVQPPNVRVIRLASDGALSANET
jgi:uncharacterized protein (TIGR02594 family)